MDQKENYARLAPESPEDSDSAPEVWLGTLELGVNRSEEGCLLYARYVRALALLCECVPFVDDEEYVLLVDELLADACKHYPLAWRQAGVRREIALRSPET
jgi:hypothetical protein